MRTRTSLFILFSGLLLVAPPTRSCLTFSFQSGERVVYGRNFDWNVGVGAVMVNQRGVNKMAFVLPPEKPLRWQSEYGSVTFNQFSKEIPVGGMNEKGLVIESLVSTAEHPAKDERLAVNELQWIQYHLDTCKNVEEVLASTKKIRITPYAVRLHYYLADAEGNTAVIEWIDGKLVQLSGDELPVRVLANSPYRTSMQSLPQSRDRFARAAHLVGKADRETDSRAFTFEVLDTVAQGSFTKWQVVYDLTNLTITFRTSVNRDQRWIALKDLDFATETAPRMMDVNGKGKGDLKDVFQPYTKAANDKLIDTCLVEFQRTGIARRLTPLHVRMIRELLYATP